MNSCYQTVIVFLLSRLGKLICQYFYLCMYYLIQNFFLYHMSILTFLKKPVPLFLLKFAILFFTLRFLYLGYVAVSDGRGIYHWNIPPQYDLIYILRNTLKYPVSWILQLAGHKTYISLKGVHLKEGGTIFISFSCLGIKVMLVYISMILAYPGRRKLLFLFSGLLMIHILNISRMSALLFMLLHHAREKAFIAHDVFNYGSYVIILSFFYMYITQKDSQQRLSE